MKCSIRPAAFLEGECAGWWRFAGSVILLALLSLSESSCQKRQVQIPNLPPAPAPSNPTQATPAPAKAAPEIPPPPALAPETPAPGQENAIPNPPLAPPPPPARPTRRSGRQAPAPPAQQPTTPVAPAPQLGIVLSPDEERQYNADIDQRIQHAEASLLSIANRPLTDQQKASMEEAQNFIRQAQATRKSDLPGARRLAERAEVLAGNLASSLR